MAEPEVLRAEELSKILDLGRRATYEAIARGDIPGVLKIGRSIRISRHAVEQWLHGANSGTEERGLNEANPPDTSEENTWRVSPSS